ncbi:MAG TPA: DUF4157 domain-containing protein [Bacteroidia bacterium]|nr:DUF4157 domain-containing protein [Bacteroidia bacterium]
MEYINRKKQTRDRIQRKRDQEHWEEVHNQMLGVQQGERVQKKSLEISNPGDTDEKEADEVARKVMSGESAEVHGTGGTVSRKGEGNVEATPEFEAKLNSSKGSGQSLDISTQNEMGPKIGADLSGVKVHTGNEAQGMSESINAKAFTYGQDIYFNQGQSPQNKELLAHELTHTVQQKGSVQRKIQRSIKMEFQTTNMVFAINKKKDTDTPATYNPQTQRLNRKFTPTTDILQKHDDEKYYIHYFDAPETESGGNTVTYLARGKRGEKRKSGGGSEYVPAEGNKVTEGVNESPFTWEAIDVKKISGANPHFTLQYRFPGLVDEKTLTGTPPAEINYNTLIQGSKINNSPGAIDKAIVTPFSYKIKFLNADGSPMNVSQNPAAYSPNAKPVFKQGEGVLMKKKQLTDIKLVDADKDAQIVKTFRFTKDVTGASIAGKQEGALSTDAGELELISITDNAKDVNMDGMYNANTFQFIYQSKDGSVLDVHQDINGLFQSGTVKLMKVGKQSRTDIDFTKQPQYVEVWKVYVVGPASDTETGIIRYKAPGSKIDSKVTLTPMTSLWKDNSDKPGTYIPGSYEQNFYMDDQFVSDQFVKYPVLLPVHLDEGRLKDGHYELKNTGQKTKSSIKTENDAEKITVVKVTINETKGDVGYYDPSTNTEHMVTLKSTSTVSSKAANKNIATTEFRYYLSQYFDADKLKPNSPMMQVHLEDGRLQEGHVKFMESRKIPATEEQTSIELQSETDGVLEFETPKWFSKWPELKDRVQEAVDMTNLMNTTTPLSDSKLYEKKILDSIRGMRSSGYVGTVIKFPFDISHFTGMKSKTDGVMYFGDDTRDFYVEISDPLWKATIQSSESVALSDYESLLKEHENPAFTNRTITNADALFNKYVDAFLTKPENSHKTKSIFGNLKGFVQMVTNYILRGQTIDVAGTYTKAAFMIMARTDFASMYRDMLNADEKTIFNLIAGDPLVETDNPMLTADMATAIKGARVSAKNGLDAEKLRYENQKAAAVPKEKDGWTEKIDEVDAKIVRNLAPVVLNKDTPFFIGGYRKVESAKTVTIRNWLQSIVIAGSKTEGKDELSGEAGFSAAMGQKTSHNEMGDKDYHKAQFEIRGSEANGVRNVLPASKWVEYAKTLFDSASTRSSDTPDDPTTSGKNTNESANTSLKK